MLAHTLTLALAALLTTASLAAGQQQYPMENSEAPPVVCVLGFMHIYRHIGRTCFSERDGELLSTLSDEIERFEAFIEGNSDLKKSELNKRMNELISMPYLSRSAGICDVSTRNGILTGYLSMRNAGSVKLRENTSRLLVAPRKLGQRESCV